MATNSIPEGNYQFCVRLFDAAGNSLSSTGEVCSNIFVMIPDPPTLITPIENEIITNQFPNFVWTSIINSPRGIIINYKLKISPIFNGQSPRTAIESNPVLLEKNNISTTSYQYLPSDLPFNYFSNAIGFVWMVQAFNQFGVPATRNEGKSELGVFKFSHSESTSIELTNLYPVDNDTIPFNPPYLITKFSPYSDDIRSIRYNLRLRKDGNSSEQILTRQIDFPSGPMNSQGLSTQEKASLLFVNVDNTKSIVSWMQNLEEGKKYYWSVTAEITKSNGEKISVSSSQSSFVCGLKKPVLKSPVNDSLITIGKNFNIKWQINQPSQLNFNQLDVIQTTGFHAYGSSSTAKTKFKVEFSKQNSFDSIYSSKIYQIPFTGNYNAGSNCDSLFSEISKPFSTINDTGTYYWRLKYLKSNDEAYYTSEVRKLKVNPVTSISCFAMNIQLPENNSTITNTKPKFSVSVKPKINKNAITGGKIKIWSMQSRSELAEDIKGRKPVLDTTFTGNDNSKIFSYSTDMSGFTRYDLNFINGDSSSVTFNADTSKHYLWNFTLNYKKDSVRVDEVKCDSNFVVSNDGIFSVSSKVASDSNACSGDCLVSASTNTSISTVTFAQDSVIKIGQFDLKLKSVSGNGASLSGEGEIKIPFLHISILVEFNGLKVNTDNQVFEGEVYAKIVDGAPYTAPEGNDFEGKALSFAEDKLKFKKIHEFSGSTGRLVSGFAGSSGVGLPIGFDKDINGYKVVIGIIGMKFTPTQALLNAAMYVEIPDLGPDVGFGLGAKNICFHKKGLSGISSAKLYLAQDFGYRNQGSWSILFKAPTPSDQGTYATWDCQGFKDLFLSAEVEFPSSWLKPVSGDTTRLVKAKFNTRAEKSGNGWQWMSSANLEECEITSAPGFKLQVQDMVFDYSTVRIPESISFTSNYRGTTSNEWKGFFIRRASFIFPDKLKTFENENPNLFVNNLIIDKTGFTADIASANIIQYPHGNFGEWGASMDSVKFKFVSSSLEQGLIKGKIKVPIFDSLLVYSGIIGHLVDSTKLHYQFLIHPPDTISTSWKIKLSLYPTSRIELTDTSGSFIAKAVLSGQLSLNGDVDKLSKLGFNGITFQEYGFRSKSHRFIKGTYSFASPQHSLFGFPVTINDIDFVTSERGGRFAAGFKFKFGVNLQPGSDAISGNTTLSLWAKMNDDIGPQSFSFDGIELDGISINADLGAVRINGAVDIYNSHPTYGNGFRGAVEAVFVDQFSVSATAQFGSVNNYRYWYVDAKALMEVGIPIYPGVGIYGFGGGAWYHMRRTGETNLSVPPSSTIDTTKTPGKTNSGYTFTPDNSTNFGFRATVILGTHPSPDAFNSDVSLEAEFLSGGGISRISILGDGYMLCSITKRASAKVTANMNMEYNFPTKTFSGICDVNIKAQPFTGGGQMLIHFSPNLWFIKIGEPSNRIALKLADWLTVNGYFMTGMNLPAPVLPEEIQSHFPSFQTQPRNPAIQQGNGFAFGAQLDINTGRKQFLKFYGQARFLGGYDMALLNYGSGTTCEGSNSSIGINGWYAMGQIYAYANASIGLHVDTWAYEGDAEILNLSVATTLQGAGPNPTWMKGYVGGNYRILGGAVKGYCNFEFKLGNECLPVVENPIVRVDMISDINPSNCSTNVDVMIEPQVASNFELDTPFELQEMPTNSQEGRLRTFRIKLKPLSLLRSNDNSKIAGSTEISQDRYSAYFNNYNMLSVKTWYKFKATAYEEEYISGNWQSAKRNDGSVIEQTVQSTFKTGDAPDNIPQTNVAFTYPPNGHKYFLQDECRNGIVQLIKNQPELFLPRQNYSLELIARFIPIDLNLQPIEVPFTYNSATKAINF